MLVITAHSDEWIEIITTDPQGNAVARTRVTITPIIGKQQVRVCFDAPRNVRIVRDNAIKRDPPPPRRGGHGVSGDAKV